MPRASHRWIIDAIDQGVARVEVDGERMLSVPRALLPERAKEGDVLDVHVEASGEERVTIDVAVDVAETTAATRASARQVERARRKSRKQDPGGDVSL